VQRADLYLVANGYYESRARVSRGGLKLAYALKEFGVSAEGKACLDVGASTGGFSDVLRQKGASKIYAVDVGHGQLHASLHGVPTIISMEGQDARDLTYFLHEGAGASSHPRRDLGGFSYVG